jgi:acyl carrier protein
MSADVDSLKNQFRSLICEDLAPIGPEELTDDTDLTAGILDSFGLVVVFQQIEDAIGRELRDDERVRATVVSLKAIVDFVERERPV